jgi:hypothetical protein
MIYLKWYQTVLTRRRPPPPRSAPAAREDLHTTGSAGRRLESLQSRAASRRAASCSFSFHFFLRGKPVEPRKKNGAGSEMGLCGPFDAPVFDPALPLGLRYLDFNSCLLSNA